MKIKLFIITIFVIFWLVTIRQALFSQLSGTFKARIIDSEYLKLENLLSQDSEFSRVLWIPVGQRYGYYSPIHPAITGTVFYNVASSSSVLSKLDKDLLDDISVKYIIVPFDQEKEIFLKDRVYSAEEYKDTINKLQDIKWLNQLPQFSKVAVFKNMSAKDHFWIKGKGNVEYEYINPVTYEVKIRNAKKGDLLIFSEGYSRGWELNINGGRISASPYEKKANSFTIPKDGDINGVVHFAPQKYTNIGVVISTLTLLVCILLIVITFL